MKTMQLAFFLLAHGFCYGQNLVPNPSFEDTIVCPEYPNEVQNAIGWSSWRETPDYFNACSTTLCDAGYLCAHVPNNFAGYQNAATGSAYCGLYCYGNGKLSAREIIGAPLIQALEPGTAYHISFKISLTLDAYPGLHWTCNHIGMRFAMSSFDDEMNPAPIDNIASVYQSELLTDTVNWSLVEGDFIASQAFTHFGIGNFFDDDHTDTLHVNGSSSGGVYFYIDDVCITPGTNCGESNLTKEETLASGIWVVENELHVNSEMPATIQLFNSQGIICLSTSTLSRQKKIPLDLLSPGIYFVKVTSSKNSTTKRIYKS